MNNIDWKQAVKNYLGGKIDWKVSTKKFLEGGKKYDGNNDSKINTQRTDNGQIMTFSNKIKNKNNEEHLIQNIVPQPNTNESGYPLLCDYDYISNNNGDINSKNLYNKYGQMYDIVTNKQNNYDYYLNLEKEIKQLHDQREKITEKYLNNLYDESVKLRNINLENEYNRRILDKDNMFPIVEHYGFYDNDYTHKNYSPNDKPYSKEEYLKNANYYRFINSSSINQKRIDAINNWYKTFDKGITDKILRKEKELNDFNKNMYKQINDILSDNYILDNSKNNFFRDVVNNDKAWLQYWLNSRKDILRQNNDNFYNYFESPIEANNRFNEELKIDPNRFRKIDEKQNQEFENNTGFVDYLFNTDTYNDNLLKYQLNSQINNIQNTPVYITGYGATQEQNNNASKEGLEDAGLSFTKGYYDPKKRLINIPLGVFEGQQNFDNSLNEVVAHELTHSSNAEPQEYNIYQYEKQNKNSFLDKEQEYDEYKDSPQEILARRNMIFRKLNINPKHKWTKKEVEKYKKNNPGYDIFNRYSTDFLLYLFNDIAMNDNKDLNYLNNYYV